jgi:nuclear pore complex protein Nup133
MPQEEMESLYKDYRSETTQLEELDLEDDYQKVRELAVHDIMWDRA